MPKVDVLNVSGRKVAEMELSDDIFGGPVKEHLFQEVVRWQLACRRRGTVSSLGRGQVTGSRRKLFRQKGTGRARRGNQQSPLLKGGGIAFGPRPRDFAFTLPRKVRKAALRSALSRRLEEARLMVLDAFELEEVRTRRAADILRGLSLSDVLIVDEANRNLSLSTRNLRKVTFLPVEGLNVMDILRHEHLVITRRAVTAVEGRLKS
ncbi:MAG: 50S ribosomal protein L4 [Deltaproteobacteria bacterium]|nr:50S ribosomal protein L4 [Deltaproteobacteria bacterium]